MDDGEGRLTGPTVGALRTFAYFVAAGTMGHDVLDGLDYWEVMRQEPSLMEQAFAIFANNLRLDDDGYVINAKEADRRSAQWVRQYLTGETADPPFDGSPEVELHWPFGLRPPG